MRAPTYAGTKQPVGLGGAGGSAIAVRAQRFRPNTSGLGQEWEAVANSGKALQGVAKDVDAWGMAEQKSRLMKAKVGAYADLSRFKMELEAETDPNELDRKWNEGSQEIFERHGQTIADAPGMSEGWDLYRQEETARFGSQVGSLRKKRIIDQGLGTFVGGVEDLAELLPGARTDEEFVGVMERGGKLVRDAQAAGFLTAKEGEVEFRKWGVRVMTAKALRDMEADADGTIARLNDMNEYRGLTPEVRQKLQEKAEKKGKEQNLEQAYAFVKGNFPNGDDAADYLEDPENLKKHGLDLKDALNLANRFEAEGREAEREDAKAKAERSEAANKRLQVLHFKDELTEEAVLKELDDLNPGMVDFYRRALAEKGGTGSAFTALIKPLKAAEDLFLREVSEDEQDLHAFTLVLQNEVEKFEAGPDGKKKRKASPMEIHKIARELIQTVDGYQKDDPLSWMGATPENISGEMKSALSGEGLTQSWWSSVFSKEPRVYDRRYEELFQEGVELGSPALANPLDEAARQWLIDEGAPVTPANIKAAIREGKVK